MKSTSAVLFALASMASTAPITYSPTFFGVIVARSASPIHLSSIVASDGGIWIGKNSSAFCPAVEGQECPDYSPYPTFGLNNGILSLAVQNPFGQDIYIDYDGKVRYTTANNPFPPWGAKSGGWSIKRDPQQPFGYLSYTNGTVFCPTGKGSNATVPKGPWEMYALVDGVTLGEGCLGGSLLESGNSTKALAWEYL